MDQYREADLNLNHGMEKAVHLIPRSQRRQPDVLLDVSSVYEGKIYGLIKHLARMRSPKRR